HHAGRGGPGTVSQYLRTGLGDSPGTVAAPRAEVRARLRRPVHRAHHPGQRGLRLRLPGQARPQPRTRSQVTTAVNISTLVVEDVTVGGTKETLMIQGFDPRTGEPVGEPVPDAPAAAVNAPV